MLWWESEAKKVARDLRSSFSGKGKRGLTQWLKIGRFLSRLDNEEQVCNHNDRCDCIAAIIGGEDKIDKLLDKLSVIINEMAVEAGDKE